MRIIPVQIIPSKVIFNDFERQYLWKFILNERNQIGMYAPENTGGLEAFLKRHADYTETYRHIMGSNYFEMVDKTIYVKHDHRDIAVKINNFNAYIDKMLFRTLNSKEQDDAAEND